MDKEDFKDLFKELLESKEIEIHPVTRSSGQEVIQVYVDNCLVYESD